MNPVKNKISTQLISTEAIELAHQRLKDVVEHTPLSRNYNLSKEFCCDVYLKREDMQIVRSFKIRGAYNKMKSLSEKELKNGIVCASAGNHAQGVALACQLLNVDGVIVMPSTTSKQKIQKVKHFGEDKIHVILKGDTFDDAYAEAKLIEEKESRAFIHPFDDDEVIAGQATIAIEILKDIKKPIDYLFVSVGGGGLISGLGSYFKQVSPQTKIIGIEPTGAPALFESLKANKVVQLENIDGFADGIAVKRIGDRTFSIIQKVLDDFILVPEGKICSTILSLYNEEAIVVEPAGAISISALDEYRDILKGKTVVCLVSGGNNDILRTAEIRERSLLYEGRKHYFIVRFPQRAGALREFLNVLGPNDDIAHFEYTKKNNRENGPALVGIELKDRADFDPLIANMKKQHINFQHLNDNPMLFEMLV
jgi:threonine dehydratase